MGSLSERRKRAEEEKAEDYAWAIRNRDHITPDWKALNATIIDEFGLAGLRRIKKRAWNLLSSGGSVDEEGTDRDSRKETPE